MLLKADGAWNWNIYDIEYSYCTEKMRNISKPYLPFSDKTTQYNISDVIARVNIRSSKGRYERKGKNALKDLLAVGRNYENGF